MQVGLPIVSTNKGGQVDFLLPGRNALLVPIKSSQFLADAVTHLINDKKLILFLSKNNQFDLKSHSVKNVVSEYFGVAF